MAFFYSKLFKESVLFKKSFRWFSLIFIALLLFAWLRTPLTHDKQDPSLNTFSTKKRQQNRTLKKIKTKEQVTVTRENKYTRLASKVLKMNQGQSQGQMQVQNQGQNQGQMQVQNQLKQNQHLFPIELSKAVHQVSFIRLTGFQFCTMLENMAMNPWTLICTISKLFQF